jgi:drug/metabolite transporter (DMT)-like permease
VLGVFEPITAILVGALAFGEPVTMNVLIGIGLTMAAVTFMIVSSNK